MEEMPWPWIAHELKREESAVTQHWRIMNKRDSKPANQVLPSAQQAIPDTKDDQKRTTELVTQRHSRTSDEPGRKRRLENASLRTPNTGSVEGNEASCTDEVPHDWEATGILGETIVNGKKHYWITWAPTITDDLEKIKKSVKRWNAAVSEIAAGGKKLFWVAWPPTLEPEDNLGNMRELKREWNAKRASGLLLRSPPSCQSPVQGTDLL
ncbi:hypothetical protein F5883DRAFT_656385 [Diaporthe sp. PMI_573]|nr:hypothetical protein F5883DRAFT_656385 [Diaporthaceae sp. PMI_573]